MDPSDLPEDAPIVLSKILDRGLAGKPDEDALVSLRARWTWRELDAVSSRLAGSYLDLGLRAGDRIASLMPNRCELAIHYLACFKAGLVSTPLNYRYTAPEIDHALGLSGSRMLLAHDERAEDLALSQLAGGLPLGTISYDDSGGSGERPFGALMEHGTAAELASPPPESVAVIFFTSGSTGKPKGVTHTHETYGWLIKSAMLGMTLGRDDVVLPGSSMSHLGSHLAGFAAMAAGGRLLEARSFDPTEVLALIRAERPSVLSMLPVALFNLLREPGVTKTDLDSLRYCISGGDKVSAELDDAFSQLTGMPIEEGYGMTEIGFALINPLSPDHRHGSLGLPQPGYSLSIRDDDGRELPAGSEGRLWVRHSGITVGYWENPDASAETIQDGWLDTGDVMRRDEDGYFWFHGRKKQIIVHDGSNICPQEVEEVLLQHPAVTSAGVVGVHNLVHGENVKAYVTLAADQPTPEMVDLIRFAKARVGYKAPEEVVALEAMPLNATGKVDRVTLKRMAAEHHDAEHPGEDH